MVWFNPAAGPEGPAKKGREDVEGPQPAVPESGSEANGRLAPGECTGILEAPGRAPDVAAGG